MKKTYVALGLVIVLSLQGCAAVMASNQPHKKNLSVLEVGKHRNNVISELGAPVTSEIQNGERKEIYTFQQGYSKGARISRTLWHTTADIATIEIYFCGRLLVLPQKYISMVNNFHMRLFLMIGTISKVPSSFKMLQRLL